MSFSVIGARTLVSAWSRPSATPASALRSAMSTSRAFGRAPIWSMHVGETVRTHAGYVIVPQVPTVELDGHGWPLAQVFLNTPPSHTNPNEPGMGYAIPVGSSPLTVALLLGGWTRVRLRDGRLAVANFADLYR